MKLQDMIHMEEMRNAYRILAEILNFAKIIQDNLKWWRWRHQRTIIKMKDKCGGTR
jgi:hypothetical protein